MRQVRTFKEIISSLYEALGVHTDIALAKFLGVTSQAIAQARRNGKVPESWIIKIASHTNCSIDDVIFGDAISAGKKTDLILVPLARARVSAGGGSLETSSEIIDYYAFRKDWLEKKGHHGNMALMQVSGDSMEPMLFTGDLVLVDQSKKDIIPHQIYVVRVGEGIYVKELTTLPKNILRLHSVNTNYENLDIDLDADDNSIEIIGRVLWWCHEALNC